MPRQELTLTLYFSGTGHFLADKSKLASFLYKHTAENEKQVKAGFSGCGITNGISGILFGSVLQDQCQSMKNWILTQIKAGKKIKLNCYGHSRGGIAALFLAQMLGGFDEDLLEINLALLDAVPGNFIFTQKLDFVGQTLANQAMDLSKCRNLKRVLSLYTNEPQTPDELAVFAPLFPKYPKKTEVEEDVLPGRHSLVQLQFPNPSGFAAALPDQSVLTFTRVKAFLESCGTTFRFAGKRFSEGWREGDRLFSASKEIKLEDATTLTEIYEREKQQLKPSTRAAHSCRSAQIKTDPAQRYVNKHHQSLAQPEAKVESATHYALRIEPPLSPRDPRTEEVYSDPRTLGRFKSFLTALYNSLSEKSKQSEKGRRLADLQSQANKLGSFENDAALKNALRNILALSLQRDRYRFSFFSTTTSGYTARALLQDPEYRSLAELIQGTATHKMRYRDLRMFVIGENKENYFNSKNRELTYDILKKSNLTQDNSTALLKSRVD